MLCGWNYFQPRFREKNRELQRADSMKHLAVKFTNHKCFCPRQLKKTFCTLLQPNCKLMANGRGEQGSAETEIVLNSVEESHISTAFFEIGTEWHSTVLLLCSSNVLLSCVCVCVFVCVCSRFDLEQNQAQAEVQRERSQREKLARDKDLMTGEIFNLRQQIQVSYFKARTTDVLWCPLLGTTCLVSLLSAWHNWAGSRWGAAWLSSLPPAGQGERTVQREYEGAAAGGRATGSVLPGV